MRATSDDARDEDDFLKFQLGLSLWALARDVAGGVKRFGEENEGDGGDFEHRKVWMRLQVRR